MLLTATQFSLLLTSSVFCLFYLGRVYFPVPPLSVYLSLTPSSSSVLLSTSVTTTTITVTKTILVFHQELSSDQYIHI